MKKIYFTLTGTNHYYGKDFLEVGMKLQLEKEPDNKFDKEAIKVMHDCIGMIGHVANSVYTVIGERCYSAGRLYDKIGDKAECTVALLLDAGIICFVEVENE